VVITSTLRLVRYTSATKPL